MEPQICADLRRLGARREGRRNGAADLRRLAQIGRKRRRLVPLPDRPYSRGMPRFFNTTGPCNPDDHYILPPEARLVGAQLDRYIESKLYWVLHAPRQSGKTTFLQSWMRKINAEGKALACYVSVERCQQFPDAAEAMPAICAAIREYADAFIGPALTPALPQAEPASAL